MHGKPYRFYQEVALIYDGHDCLIWPYGCSASGYGQVSINGLAQRVSRLVCADAHGKPPTPNHEAAHSCGNGSNGCVAKNHLRWATRTENERDKLLHDTHNRGERNKLAKLTEKDVRQIRGMKGKKTQRAIAARFGVSKSLVGDIHRRDRWSWLA